MDISGRLTLGLPVQALRDIVAEAIAGGARNLLLNMAEVAYLDSAGIGQLTGCMRMATAAGGKLKLLHVTPRVDGLLRLTHVLPLFEVHIDEQQALESFDEKIS